MAPSTAGGRWPDRSGRPECRPRHHHGDSAPLGRPESKAGDISVVLARHPSGAEFSYQLTRSVIVLLTRCTGTRRVLPPRSVHVQELCEKSEYSKFANRTRSGTKRNRTPS